MFEGLSDNLKNAISLLRGGKLTEKSLQDGMRLVRQALLEADVNYDVVEDFVKTVRDRAVGQQVIKQLRPDQHFIGIVHQELTNLMGPEDPQLTLKKHDVTVIMMCGLQGSGKTTTCGKLAKLLKRRNVRPMLVAADLQRPAAIEQLKVIGQQVGVPVYAEDPQKSNPVQVCNNALKQAKQAKNIDVVILDTAGRLHIDDSLMDELRRIDNKCQPDMALLVTDAMTGQDAVNSAKAFNEALDLDGLILTKLDGDTRGGAALSVKAVTGVPIKFIGVGEDLDGLEHFSPSGMAQRILGFGDVVGLFQDISQQMDQEEARKQEEKMRKGTFNLNDFRSQMEKIAGMGSISRMLGKIPGFNDFAKMMPDMDPEKDMGRIRGILDSMTSVERENPDLIDRSRRNRIARGCGQDPAEINNLLKQFKGMASMMKEMANMSLMDRMRMMQQMGQGGMAGLMGAGGDMPKAKKQRSQRGPSASEHRELRKKKNKEKKKAQKRNRK